MTLYNTENAHENYLYLPTLYIQMNLTSAMQRCLSLKQLERSEISLLGVVANAEFENSIPENRQKQKFNWVLFKVDGDFLENQGIYTSGLLICSNLCVSILGC